MSKTKLGHGVTGETKRDKTTKLNPRLTQLKQVLKWRGNEDWQNCKSVMVKKVIICALLPDWTLLGQEGSYKVICTLVSH